MLFIVFGRFVYCAGISAKKTLAWAAVFVTDVMMWMRGVVSEAEDTV